MGPFQLPKLFGGARLSESVFLRGPELPRWGQSGSLCFVCFPLVLRTSGDFLSFDLTV